MPAKCLNLTFSAVNALYTYPGINLTSSEVLSSILIFECLQKSSYACAISCANKNGYDSFI